LLEELYDRSVIYLLDIACEFCTTLNGGDGLTGTAKRKRASSCVIPHSGMTLDAALAPR